MNFFTTASETELRPHEDPEVVRLQAALYAAREQAEPASQAWGAYLAAHWEDATRFPFPRDKQKLFDQLEDTAAAVTAAEAAYTVALTEATQRATARWDDRIRQAFLADQSLIEQFIVMLERHEELATEAELAGVNHALSVSKNFLTSAEVAARLEYAKKALGLDE